ncbi:E3 ubiquitin-protein ligase rnf146 [Salvelinus alpinus]|uniref:E3 ubiquitin-protein ligase n=1 Tax=Salvelinus namaycush TaxID=8040 RepID=A0A8U0PHU4_SALNM|nr:E3 ubiquitin-protein ligase rnf146 [Salvelinus alpinus]XP_023829967.1 E3 ubiquitin-protein ligase rnf146 [Salvelinus alpinus]XP_038824766.1 E3 ubiquitin-protein ligase rnf146-like [Salvelinus namaycush]XP_038824767.1 E3 ubiquitin-protein ligase rnf146-like [Salvelinus namaycush]
MASCGEVDHSVDSVSSSKVEDGGDAFTGDSPSSPTPSANPVPECAICLQTCVHPVRLPCRHVFCFLCVKGASWHSKRCALCRQEVPEDFLEHPTLLSPEELKAAAAGGRGGTGPGSAGGDHAWYYEGRNGWWQYDERTSRELEDAFAKGRKSAEMLIAGFLYVADLENMVQYRRNEHGRRRRMKRDVVDIPKKGVAGLRLDPDPTPPVVAVAAVPVTAATVERPSSADGEDVTGRSQAGGLGVVIPAPPVRPPTVLGAHPATAASISLEDSLSQLLISQPEGEEEENEEVASRISQVYESASGSSEDEDGAGDEVGRGWDRERGGREVGSRRRPRHRLLQRRLREVQPDRLPPGGGSSSGGLSVRSRSPDGQCTVTEV